MGSFSVTMVKTPSEQLTEGIGSLEQTKKPEFMEESPRKITVSVRNVN